MHSLMVALAVECEERRRLPRKHFSSLVLAWIVTYVELFGCRASLAAVLPLTGQRIATDTRLRNRLQRGLSLCCSLLLLKRSVSRRHNLRVVVVGHFGW